MLEFYHRLALRLAPFRPLLWLLGMAAVAVFGLTLFGPPHWRQEAYSVAAMALLLWTVLGAGIAYGFRPPLPEVAADAGRWQRLRTGFQRGLLGLYSAFLTVLAVMVLYATARSAGMLLQALGN